MTQPITTQIQNNGDTDLDFKFSTLQEIVEHLLQKKEISYSSEFDTLLWQRITSNRGLLNHRGKIGNLAVQIVSEIEKKFDKSNTDDSINQKARLQTI